MRRATSLRQLQSALCRNFYPRSPCGERLNSICLIKHIGGFLSTLSLRRATGSNQTIISKTNNFYPRSPCGERRLASIFSDGAKISIHALLAESDLPTGRAIRRRADFYPRSPCGERRARRESRQQPAGISIHALLAESDGQLPTTKPPRMNFYPRSPCGERQVWQYNAAADTAQFLSTLSLRRATRPTEVPQYQILISIHALLAESDSRRALGFVDPDISIHALLAESDVFSCYLDNIEIIISIHALLAESDHYDNYNLHCVEISIHALLAESDEQLRQKDIQIAEFLSTLSLRRATISCAWSASKLGDFYPRSPCGERLTSVVSSAGTTGFLSTLSLRRATKTRRQFASRNRDFYPRSPCGERPVCSSSVCTSSTISIHALLAESDNTVQIVVVVVDAHFYPRSPCGERQR